MNASKSERINGNKIRPWIEFVLDRIFRHNLSFIRFLSLLIIDWDFFINTPYMSDF